MKYSSIVKNAGFELDVELFKADIEPKVILLLKY